MADISLTTEACMFSSHVPMLSISLSLQSEVAADRSTNCPNSMGSMETGIVAVEAMGSNPESPRMDAAAAPMPPVGLSPWK